MTNLPRATQPQPRELLHLLQQQSSEPIDRFTGISKHNTTNLSFDSVRWDSMFPNVVQKSDDFTYEAIMAAYGDLLESSAGISSQLNSYLQHGDVPRTPKGNLSGEQRRYAWNLLDM